MTKKMVMVLLALMLLPWSAPLAAEATAESPPAYQSTTTYAGIYKADRLYQLNSVEQTWYASQRFRTWTSLSCSEARGALFNQGTWVGNLTDAGACAGHAEAPSWATGNYLNYLISTRVAGPEEEE
jgi:hypothetical protein